MKKDKSYLFLAKTFNPLVLVIYGIICFYMYSLSQYGGVKRKVPIIISSTILLIIWFLWSSYKKIKKTKVVVENQEQLEITKKKSISDSKEKFSKVWFFIACLILILTTFITSIKIYKSAIPYNGKLSWYIQEFKNKRQISFIDNNIYENNIEGIFDSIEEKINLPEELYLSSDFNLNFKKDGTITSFDTYVYGKNEKMEIESFLISYDEDKSEKIIVYLNGFVEDSFNKEKRFNPLMDILQLIPLKETVSTWNEDQYAIIYKGVRDWDYNDELIFYVDEEGNIFREKNVIEKIPRYTASLYIAGKEKLASKARFIYKGEKYFFEDPITDGENNDNDKWDLGYNYNEGEETFFINKKLGYQLSIVDAALGSRFYALIQTKDGGETWEIINKDPYLNRTGVSSGINFINESLGFIALSHSGGVQADLYRTTDGGLSYEKNFFPTIEVALGEDQIQEPFDFPEMPYEENGKMLVLVGQGQDGDYKGGVKALYQSEDDGTTWTFVNEQ